MSDTFEGWAILELMGHRRMAGHLSEQQIGGASFLRIDVPTEPPATQFYSPSAVYAITPCTEDTARAAAALGRPAPVSRWELPAVPVSTGTSDEARDLSLAGTGDFDEVFD